MHGGDPLIGRRLITLAREARFERLEATARYSAGLAEVRKGKAAPRCFPFWAERIFVRLADGIAIWERVAAAQSARILSSNRDGPMVTVRLRMPSAHDGAEPEAVCGGLGV